MESAPGDEQMKSFPINVQEVLAPLKEFQRRSVDYIFNRMYGPNPTTRFLLADEVGLGKTLVARGIIAKAIEHLWNKVDRIDVIYICSNSDIARQNITSLNITGKDDFALATRITLLPQILSEKRLNNRLNFVSFTPGTSFELKGRTGIIKERVLLYWLTTEAYGHKGSAAINVFRATARYETFRRKTKDFEQNPELDNQIRDSFMHELKLNKSLREKFKFLCKKYERNNGTQSWETRREMSYFIGQLRNTLARTCLRSLEPDLIILDEFQQFKYLLNGQDEAAQLAKELFTYCDKHTQARVLLLSATPYKMYTLSQESQDDDHYTDFIQTLDFLFEHEVEKTERFKSCLEDYRKEIYRIADNGTENLIKIKTNIENQLSQVMVRTERLASTID